MSGGITGLGWPLSDLAGQERQPGAAAYASGENLTSGARWECREATHRGRLEWSSACSIMLTRRAPKGYYAVAQATAVLVCRGPSSGGVVMDVVNVNNVLDRLFSGHRSPEHAAAWEVAKSRFALGSKVQGIVVAQFQFGVFLDINAGFPALLLVTRMSEPPYTTMEQYPAIGSAVEARVCVWAGPVRQIGLTRLKQEPMLGES